MLRVKNTVTETKSFFNGVISRLDIPEETISKLEDVNRKFP